MSTTRAVARSSQWWGHKLPPTIAVAAVAIGLGRPTGADLVDLCLLLVSMVGVAAFGHLVNDWSDLEADRRGGKVNLLGQLPNAHRSRLVAGSLVLGLVPWAFLPFVPAALVALAIELVLLLAYSLPPVRLKGRGWLGAVADASYAYAVPFTLAYVLFAPAASVTVGAAALLAAWGMLGGLRGILWHQIGDMEADRAAGVETAAARIGPSRTEALVAAILLPFEVASALVLVAVTPAPWLPWLVGGFVAWRWFQVALLWMPPLELQSLLHRKERVDVVGFAFVNEFVERWLPVAALTALALDSRWWWIGVVCYLLVFPSAPRSFLAHDLWLIPDALQRLALSWGIRAEIRQVAARRRARIAAGPPSDPAPGRFVFVVCGPVSHLLTLRTAIHHLRPVTDAEIWVLTDGRRNEHVIDIEGIDHVVDVATPDDLDDHQASIWLKTSVHRHLPEGEWCYLDSDIIATVPGVEAVFAERRGPVAFASDVTIRENSVDRFSPWAMTCPCAGYGEEHSCGHLREQLQVRFGLDVPGDWLHWNGGVFLFGPDSAEVLDMWHERAVGSFAWPEWKTRDQGALIATVWTLGLQDLPRISPEFNFIADLGNHDLCLDLERGWAHHPSGPWYDPKLLHLYTSPLEDPSWDLGADVEAVVLRRSRVRVYRWERSQIAARVKGAAHSAKGAVHVAVKTPILSAIDRASLWAHRWSRRGALRTRNEARRFGHWAYCFFDPRRLRPTRVRRAIRVRRGLDVSHLPHPLGPDFEPQRSRGGDDD